MIGFLRKNGKRRQYSANMRGIGHVGNFSPTLLMNSETLSGNNLKEKI